MICHARVTQSQPRINPTIMIWYYAQGTQQIGPISEDEFVNLVRAGTITPQTLVWREGMANWQPYSNLTPALRPSALGDGGFSAASEASLGAPPTVHPNAAGNPEACENCGAVVGADNLVELEGVKACATCKPILIQRMREGLAPGGSSAFEAMDGETLVRRVRERGYQVNIGAALQGAWEMLKADFGTVIGATALVMICLMAAGSVPLVGTLISMVLTGPLLGGLYWFFIRRYRGEPATVGIAFAGFSRHAGQLMLASAITTLLAYAAMIPAGVYAAARGYFKSPELFVSSAVSDPLLMILTLGGMAVLIYFSVCWTFAIPLVIDRGYAFWPAMETSRKIVNMHWFQIAALLLVGGLLGGLGVLLCCVGVFVTMPIFFGAVAIIYTQVFR